MESYNEIDDILAEEEVKMFPVVFQKAINGVKIDESTEKGYVSLKLKQHRKERSTRLEIQADAACVDLRSRCPYFYEFGSKLAPLCDKTIGLLLPYAFRIRYKEILHKAHTIAFAAASKFPTLLTREETSLYEAAQSSMAAFKKWRAGGPRLQRASILGRKRKPAE